MTKIMLDGDLAKRLYDLQETVQLCDPAGKVVGQFHPAFDPSKWEIIGPELTDEELERRANSKGPWYTTEEVLAYLRNLENQ